MAMNKSEKAAFEEMERARDMARALRWPHYAKPSSMTNAEIKMEAGGFYAVARGWFYNTYAHGNVSYGCSNGINHNRDGDTTTTQGMGRMFRWKSDALKAMRVEMTEDFAAKLANIDRQIDAALAEEGGDL